MPVIIAKIGLGLVGLMMLFMSSMAGITLDEMIQENEKVNVYDIELIKEDVEELVNDYVEFSRKYMPQWLEENPDLKRRKPTQEDLRDFKGDALDAYMYQEEYSNLDLTEDTIDYMENSIPETERSSFKYHRDRKQYEQLERDIVYTYLRNIIDNN